MIVQDEAFLKDLKSQFPGWALEDMGSPKIYALAKDAVLEELQSFGRMLEVEKSTASAESGIEGWRKKIPALLAKASIINGSVKEAVNDLPSARVGLMLFQELLDLFKSKG